MNKPFKLNAAMPVFADIAVSISELKKNPAAIIAEARKRQVAITNRNRPVAYLISPEVWDHILDVFDEQKLAREYGERLGEIEEAVPVTLDDLLE